MVYAEHVRDSLDHAYGCKSSTLEAVGLLLPFLCIPQLLVNKSVLLLTDNEALTYGWDSKKIRHDVSASIFIRALHIITFYLGCHVHVQHIPRNSTFLATIADGLTRDSSRTPEVLSHLTGVAPFGPPEVLWRWLQDPREDWQLAFRLLDSVKAKINL